MKRKLLVCLPLAVMLVSLFCFLGCGQSNNTKNEQNSQIKADTNTIVLFRNWRLNVDQLKLTDTARSLKGFKIIDISKDPCYWTQKKWSDKPQFPVMSKKDTVAWLKIERESIILLDGKNKKTKWQYTTANNYMENAKSILCGDSLYIANYSPIATGSALICLSYSSGKVIWIGDVKQLMICHSKYKNEVFIHKVGNKIVIAGDESGGILQVVDSRSGKNLFCTHDAASKLLNDKP